MTHDELLAKIWEEIKHCGCDDGMGANCHQDDNKPWEALRAVVELHRPIVDVLTPLWRYSQCKGCNMALPCPTIQAIEKELA